MSIGEYSNFYKGGHLYRIKHYGFHETSYVIHTSFAVEKGQFGNSFSFEKLISTLPFQNVIVQI
jgi:hypothetical protein